MIQTAKWYVESDGHGPYVCENGMGRVCSIEQAGFGRNGGKVDWDRAHLIAASPALLDSLDECIGVLETLLAWHASSMSEDDRASREAVLAKAKRVRDRANRRRT